MEGQDPVGCIKVCTLDERLIGHLRVSKIGGVLALKDGGPTRILFDAGGHIDICGGADYWKIAIRIVEMGGTQPD